MDIFVGSLPFKLKEEELKKLFEQYGEVISVKIIIDKITRQNKGFGFVGMPNETEANAAIEGLNGFEIYGRSIVVNQSEERKPKPASNTKKFSGFDKKNNNKNSGFNRNFKK